MSTPSHSTSPTASGWPLVAGHFARWQGREPLAIRPAIHLLRHELAALGTTLPVELTSERWAALLTAGTAALARLIELGSSTDDTLARDAREGAQELAPLLEQMAGDLTQKLSKSWRTS